MNQATVVPPAGAREAVGSRFAPVGGKPGLPLRSRRRPKWIAAGVLSLVLGALGGITLYGQATESHTVVQVMRPISRGEVIAPGDLGVVTIGSTPGVSVVEGNRVSDLVGQTARTDLTERSLLPEGAVGEPLVAEGQVHLGLRLPPGRIPLADLAPGTDVLLVPVPGPNGVSPTQTESIPAVIGTRAVSAPDGTAMVLDVSVNREHAELVALLAAGDQLSLVRLN